MRLDKYLGNAGIASRRDIKRLLKSHEVTVNGKRMTTSGIRINTETDQIALDGQTIVVSKHVYFMLNKPLGVISTVSDHAGRESVVDYIDTTTNIFPIGRLDKDTSGLILLTDDGDLTHKLIHPKYHVPKVYHLTIANKVTEPQLKSFRRGILLADGITLPAKAEILQKNEENTIVEVTLVEGKNRQIRRMCEEMGMNLTALKRVKFGAIDLGILADGEYKELTETEVEDLRKNH